MLKRVAAMTLGAVLTLAAGSFAAVPQEIGYQGYLTDADGVPVYGSVNITFSLYTTSAGGTALWSENQTLSTDKGIYSVSLGAVTPLTLPFDTRYYLGIKVGNDVELSPRQPLASTPYAYRAKWVDSHSHSAADITSGTLPNASLSGFYSLALGLTNVGNVFYGTFSGSGANLTNLDASKLTGTIPITSLSGTYSQALSLTNASNSFTGNGAALTSLNASNFTSGTIPDARLPLNVQKKYGKVAVVAQSGGDYTNPVTAMGAIASWCGTPSAANPCLLKIMPGVYNIGGSSLTMQQYVDIEGAGENVTIITGTVNTPSSPTSGLIIGANRAEIRFLTIENIGSTNHVAAFWTAYASPKITNVTVSASGGYSNYGVYNSYESAPVMRNVTATAKEGTINYGVYNNYAFAKMNNVTATASGDYSYGIYNNQLSAPTMHNVTATASGTVYVYGVYNNDNSYPTMINVTANALGGTNSYGVYNKDSAPMIMSNVTATALYATSNIGLVNSITAGSSGTRTVLIDRSTFEGSNYSISNNANYILKIGASKLTGGPVNAVGTYNCVGVYDGDTYTALNANCQ